jgi:hypothetical protein
MRIFCPLFILLFAVFIGAQGIALAESAGWAVDWKPFVALEYLKSPGASLTIMPRNLFLYREIWEQADELEELPGRESAPTGDPAAAKTKKTVLDRIKITVSPHSSFLLPYDEVYGGSGQNRLFQASRIIPSLLRNPSTETAVETIRLIEPQINFGFEF